jgi:hypothetical protein
MHRTVGLVVIGTLLRVCGRHPSPSVEPGVATPVGVAPVAASASGRVPAPRHGGRVQIVGDYAVETVAAQSGGVAMFWMDLDGRPISPSQMSLSSVRVDVNGTERDVPVHVVNGAYVARVAVPASAVVAVTVPHVVIYGVPFEAVVVPAVVVVAALPGIIVVPAAPVIIVGKHRGFHKFRGGFYWH